VKVFSAQLLPHRFATWEEANRFAAESVEDVIILEDPDTVAAVIVEPVGNTGGIITPTPEYFRIIREACDRHNVVLIFDEVITGFAKNWKDVRCPNVRRDAGHHLHRQGISNGVIPLGAMIARENMAEAFFGPPEAGLQFAHATPLPATRWPAPSESL